MADRSHTKLRNGFPALWVPVPTLRYQRRPTTTPYCWPHPSDEDPLTLPSPVMEPASPARASGSRRHRDPPAIRGNFIPLSKSPTKSSIKRSPSPRRHQDSKVVHLKLSLTDSQMDKLAAALSDEGEGDQVTPRRGRGRQVEHGMADAAPPGPVGSAARMRSRSPGKAHHKPSTAPARARSKSPVKPGLPGSKASSHRARPTNDADVFGSPAHHGRAGILERDASPYVSPAPARHTNCRPARRPPPHIDTELAQAHAKFTGLRLDHLPAVAVHNPVQEMMASPPRQAAPAYLSAEPSEPLASSSYYSQDSIGERYPSHITPLQVPKPQEPKYLSVLEAYASEAFAAGGNSLPASRDHTAGDPNSSNDDNNNNNNNSNDDGDDGDDDDDDNDDDDDQRYAPLAAYLPEGVSHVRKASKTLIGEGGWLENTSKPAASPSPNRSGGFLTSLVKRAKEMIETNQEHRASRKSGKGKATASQLAISLNPREQSLLYCELEFVLATALNDYLTAQFNAGRLQADRLSKIAEDWQRKGRARVVGFRYDMETQLDLVRAHLHDFQFHAHGGHVFAPLAPGASASAASAASAAPAGGPPTTAAILGVIDTAKATARTLRVRTYCAPDRVIAKQLLDCQGLFRLSATPASRRGARPPGRPPRNPSPAPSPRPWRGPARDPPPPGVNPAGPFARKTGISAPVLAAAQAYYDERTASANRYRREQQQQQQQQQLMMMRRRMMKMREQHQHQHQHEHQHEHQQQEAKEEEENDKDDEEEENHEEQAGRQRQQHQQKLAWNAWEQRREREAHHRPATEPERRQLERERKRREPREREAAAAAAAAVGWEMDPAEFYVDDDDEDDEEERGVR
ncbi:hypothetical protein VTJ83DRAFT_6845 [Remersonia thermophila]|uniref:Uncharacterized protein n=1 Tax=Remersonia thermophila TaxID=72144 RepID=A0ABR4D604_9PEZI